MIKVRKEKNEKPLTTEEIRGAFYNNKISKGSVVEILEGTHCACGSNGDFVLLPKNHQAVKEGGKPYMVCEKCGESSHL